MAHRGLWITAGALAVVTILAAGALLLPYWDRTHAQAKFGTVKDTGSAATAAGSQPQPVKDGNLAVSTTTPSRQTDAQAPVAKRPAPAAKVVNREVTIYDVVAAQSEGRVNPTGQATRPANEPTASVAPTPAVADSGTNAGTNTDALEKFQDRMIQLGARAAAVKDTIERLRSEQAASGLGLRQDIAATLNRMSAYMDEAERALNGGDLKLSQKRADQAEKEITSLEEFTGR
jgi:serine/threonine-protein kinase